MRTQCAACRRGLVTHAVGRLAGAATAAVDTLRGLLAEGQPSTVRSGAVPAILSALIDVQSHAELADRLARLEELADASVQTRLERLGRPEARRSAVAGAGYRPDSCENIR